MLRSASFVCSALEIMGHVPSKEGTTKPFYVDVKITRSGWEHLAAVALTVDNFPDEKDALFGKFLEVLSEAHVRYWQLNRDVPGQPKCRLPRPLTPREAFERYVSPSSVRDGRDNASALASPLPILLVRLQDDKHAGVSAQNCSVVGYFGLRPTGASNDTHLATELFLSARHQNEAKALGIVTIATKCYEYTYSQRFGDDVRWPAVLQHRCPSLHLPSLRLMERIYFVGEQSTHGGPLKQAKAEQSDHLMFSIRLEGADVVQMANALCSRIELKRGLKPEDPQVHFSRPEHVNLLPPATPLQSAIHEMLLIAKEKWPETNAEVVRATTHCEPRALAEKASAQKQDVSARSKSPGTSSNRSSSSSSRWSHDPYQTGEGRSPASAGPNQRLEPRGALGSTQPSATPINKRVPLYQDAASYPMYDGPLRGKQLYLGRNTPVFVGRLGSGGGVKAFWAEPERAITLSDIQPTGGHFNLIAIQTSHTDLTLYDQHFSLFVFMLDTPHVAVQAPETAFILHEDRWHQTVLEISKLLHPGRVDIPFVYDGMEATVAAGKDPWSKAPLASAKNFGLR